MDCTIRVAKTKALISFAVTAKLICVFVFAKGWFSHDVAQMTKLAEQPLQRPMQGAQCTCRLVLVDNCFEFLKLLFFCFVVAMSDLVHDVEAIFPFS